MPSLSRIRNALVILTLFAVADASMAETQPKPAIEPNPKEVVVLKGHGDEVDCIAFHRGGLACRPASDGSWAVTGGKDHAIRVWDLEIPPMKKRR